MRIAGTGLALCLGFLLSACNQDSAVYAVYNCEKNITFGTTFSNGEKVIIEINGSTIELDRVSSSGVARYENGDTSFESIGASATFVEGKNSRPVKCRRD